MGSTCDSASVDGQGRLVAGALQESFGRNVESISKAAHSDGWSPTKKFCVMVIVVQLPILLLVIAWMFRR
jgi:hypothetical protein